jgi:hypothetical protein
MTTGCENRKTRPSPKANIWGSLFCLLLVALAASLSAATGGERVMISNGQNVIDFGCVGGDFKVFSNFHLVNKGNTTVKVRSINVPCNCSEVLISDSTVKPNDSVKVRLSFDTKNLYGKTIRTFKIYTSDPRAPEIEYAYRSIIGQWPMGIRPDPTSLFFLPTIKTKRLAFANPSLERVILRLLDQADTTYSIKVLSDKAVKGGKAELEVTLKDGLPSGTYLSSFRLQLDPCDGHEPFLYTVPIKIVRY